VEVARAGDRARLTVADEGPGLTREEAAHAFERFWRGAGARGEGSGLGLAIVRAIAERHGGAVRVDGSRFTLELPALPVSGNSQARRVEQAHP
jgi:signal transduction histidine kinase